MTDTDKDLQGVSLEDYNKLKSDFETLSANHSKLEKIFNERQTKTLDKEGILKALGLEKAPDKPIADVLSEKLDTLTKTVEQLQADNKAKDEALALNTKKQKVRELAGQYNFIDVNDVLSVIDYTNEDIDGQLKKIAETKKHWVSNPTNQGGSFAGSQGSDVKSIDAEIAKAQADGDIDLSISLKRKKYEMQK